MDDEPKKKVLIFDEQHDEDEVRDFLVWSKDPAGKLYWTMLAREREYAEARAKPNWIDDDTNVLNELTQKIQASARAVTLQYAIDLVDDVHKEYQFADK